MTGQTLILTMMYGLQDKGWELKDASRARHGATRVLTDEQEEQEIIKALRARTVVSAKQA